MFLIAEWEILHGLPAVVGSALVPMRALLRRLQPNLLARCPNMLDGKYALTYIHGLYSHASVSR